MEIFSNEDKEQIIKMAREAGAEMRKGLMATPAMDQRSIVNLMDYMITDVLRDVADRAAIAAFKEKGRQYVREMTLATVDRLLKLE